MLSTLLYAFGMAVFLLLFLTCIVPGSLQAVFVAFHGAARLVEKKYTSSDHLLFHYVSVPLLVAALDTLAYLMASLLDLLGRVLHSYEVVGLENIPVDRPALLIYYHGVVPSDMQYLPIRFYLHNGTIIRSVADRFLFWLPLWRVMVRNYIFPGPAEKCISTLQSGHLLQISPGGTREALFATLRYETIWNNRCGFARVAHQTGVDIIPVFTRNIRHMFIIPEFCQRLLRPLYESCRLPIVPFFGTFPVKLVTYVGKPIRADSVDSAEELAKATRQAIEQLITTHQTFPASITGAIKERFVSKKVKSL